MVITLSILIEHGLVSCEGDLGVFRGGSLVIHETLTHGGYLYRFVLSVPVVWVSKLGVLFTYDDYLCISGRHHAFPELRCDRTIVVNAVM